MNAKEIFEDLVVRAMTTLGLSSSMRPNRMNRGKPGAVIEALSPEQRAELQKLKSEDTQVHDRRLLYITGTYPENTTTIHTHTVKKEEDE